MFPKLFRRLGRAYSHFATLVLTALLAVAALATWRLYQEERLYRQLAARGQAVTVQLTRTDRRPRQVRDVFGRSVYVGFRYRGRPYETRCVSDTAWLATGDRLALLYEPQRDEFRQPRKARPAHRDEAVSRLMDWSMLSDFSPENRALLLFALTAGALFFVGSGLLATLTGLRIIAALARPVAVVAVGAAAVFFTYDAAQYYRYAAALKRDGRPMTVVVLRANRHAYDRTVPVFSYDAAFQFNHHTRIIPIEEADYERLTAGNPHLAVRYEAARNDFIAADYAPSWVPMAVALLFWLLLVQVVRPGPASQSAEEPARP